MDTLVGFWRIWEDPPSPPHLLSCAKWDFALKCIYPLPFFQIQERKKEEKSDQKVMSKELLKINVIFLIWKLKLYLKKKILQCRFSIIVAFTITISYCEGNYDTKVPKQSLTTDIFIQFKLYLDTCNT